MMFVVNVGVIGVDDGYRLCEKHVRDKSGGWVKACRKISFTLSSWLSLFMVPLECRWMVLFIQTCCAFEERLQDGKFMSVVTELDWREVERMKMKQVWWSRHTRKRRCE